MFCLTNFILLFHYTSQLLKNQGSVWYSKSCSEFQKRKTNIRSLLKTLFIEWMDPSKPSDSSSSFKLPKLQTLTKRHWRQDAFPLGGAAFWMVPGSAIMLPLALFQACVSFPPAYLLFLALSSGFVSCIYPRLNLSIFSELCLNSAPAASVLTTWGCQTPGGQILSIFQHVDTPPPPYALLCLNFFSSSLFISLHWEFRLWALV